MNTKAMEAVRSILVEKHVAEDDIEKLLSSKWVWVVPDMGMGVGGEPVIRQDGFKVMGGGVTVHIDSDTARKLQSAVAAAGLLA